MSIHTEPVRSPSYKPHPEHGHCCGTGTKDDPCWGEVKARDYMPDEGSFFGLPIYLCAGHEWLMCQGYNYVREDANVQS